MRVLVILLALAGFGALAYALLSKPSTQPGAPTSPEEAMWRTQISQGVQMLLTQGTDPSMMEQVATTIEPYGFSNEAAQLRAKAAQLRGSR